MFNDPVPTSGLSLGGTSAAGGGLQLGGGAAGTGLGLGQSGGLGAGSGLSLGGLGTSQGTCRHLVEPAELLKLK